MARNLPVSSIWELRGRTSWSVSDSIHIYGQLMQAQSPSMDSDGPLRTLQPSPPISLVQAYQWATTYDQLGSPPPGYGTKSHIGRAINIHECYVLAKLWYDTIYRHITPKMSFLNNHNIWGELCPTNMAAVMNHHHCYRYNCLKGKILILDLHTLNITRMKSYCILGQYYMVFLTNQYLISFCEIHTRNHFHKINDQRK